MIDEAVLEALLAHVADEISVPADGPERVVRALEVASAPTRRVAPRFARPLLAAAAVLVVALAAVSLLHGGSSSKSSSALRTTAPLLSPDQGVTPTTVAGEKSDAGGFGAAGLPATAPLHGADGSSAASSVPTGPVDGAKIVKTGALDLQVPHAGLRVSVNRVTGVAVGLGGYVAESKTSYGVGAPTAEITIRVPANDFDAAIARLDALPGGKVLGESENGTDVTAQYTDLQAQLTAASNERDQLLVVLSHAQSIGDILAVHDRITAVETVVEQLQGRINLLNDQATFSSLAVSLSEKSAHKASVVVHRSTPPRGLAKSWADARQGFANAVEWFIARSGGALIVLLAALALVFGIRYLYPILRRSLL